MATEVIGGASREFYTGGGKRLMQELWGMQGMHGLNGMQGSMDMRNILTDQFMNRPPNMHHVGGGGNMMMPYFPLQQGQFNNCGNELGEMVSVKKKKTQEEKEEVLFKF